MLVPIGGGGLASGVAVAIRALVPDARVIGVEPELGADARESLAAGRIVTWSADDVSRTIADGTRTRALGRRTFAHLSRLLDSIVTVSEAEIAAGVRLAAEESRLVVEPSGALSVAALAFHAGELGLDALGGRPVVAVVSGGNVDPERYLEYLAHPSRFGADLSGPGRAPRRDAPRDATPASGSPPARRPPGARNGPCPARRDASSRRGSPPSPR